MSCEQTGVCVPRRPLRPVLVLGLVLVSPVVLVILVVLVVLIMNFWQERRFADAVASAPLPDDTTVINSQTEFGHLVGNGDHCDIRVVQTVSTPLTLEEMLQTYVGWTRVVDHTLHRQTLVRVTDMEQTQGNRRLLHVEWLTLG
jgi:hypothetical protein